VHDNPGGSRPALSREPAERHGEEPLSSGMELGFVGLGMMGRPMVERLLRAGHRVHVFNRSRDPVDALAAAGANPAETAAVIAQRAEMVLTALPTPGAVDDVYSELCHEARAGQLFADHSTVRPGQNRRWASQLAAKGAAYLDAPVSGGPSGAAAGTLTVMVGGDEATFDRARPVFEAFGSTVHLCGPVGAGQVVKLVNQLLVGVHTAAIAEAAVLGAKLGADPQLLLDLLGKSYGGSTMMVRHIPRFITRDFTGATPVSLILKDLGLIHDEAKAAGVPLLLGGLAEQRFLEASARGLGGEDMAALVKLWESAAGVTVARAE
jgi:3-hydroxyisobutyrate dehydrogenase-like beta-hydroxyacid dehydrogenase